jgi:hypothetical protein
MDTKTFSFPAPIPKSKTLFHLRVIPAWIQNQEQMDILFGSLRDGSVKYWSALPSVHALYEVALKGPLTIWVGEDADVPRLPVNPVTSVKNAPSLNG